jgi:SAM-dependent methyltransferase
MGTLRWDLVQRRLAEIRPRTVLEIGCGQGAAGARLASMSEYVGVEPDPASCQVAKRRIAPLGGRVVRGDHTAVPAGTRYDLACALEVLEHIEDDKGALADWVEHVRPGGHLLLSVPAWPHRFGAMDRLVGHFRRYSPEEMHELLSGAGLTEVSVRLYGWPLGYALEAVRNRVAAGRAEQVRQTPVEERTAGSGRLLQPRALVGAAVRAGTAPFRYLQRARPRHGTGIVAVARRPGGDAGRSRGPG